ncbi:hypothetical protein Cgig2_011218 [Carnegiea gigantea]|uniref:Pseudouridine synthase RsuA/RluA-like domain-containing protein n=1 Tax=Carnegiea gigantea TaxID=171969 RepID=A0A9Q1KEZ5_9CARY|nr:hypothetical protein Cgig2_011218 [Carnegiea gigantea]
MPGNPIAIGPSNFGSIFTSPLLVSSPHQQRSIRTGRIRAPVTRRRTVVGTPIRKEKGGCCFSSSPSSSNLGLGSVVTAPSDNGCPKYDRLLPCPSTSHPLRVEHLVVLEEGPVCDYISKTLNLPLLYVADLIHFGAVHYALVHPEPPATASPEQIQLYERFTSPLFLKQRKSLKEKTIKEAQKTYRITHVDEYVEVGTYLRVYVHPRRFPRCYEIDWKSRIIAVTESYVVLDKPAGISVGGTSNNIEETCANFATRALGLTSPLMTTHQIDNCTEGCLVLARTEEYCSVFHRKIRDKLIKKLYLSLASAPMPCGMITHYMHPSSRAPRIISEGNHVMSFTNSLHNMILSTILKKQYVFDDHQHSVWILPELKADEVGTFFPNLMFGLNAEYVEGWQLCQLEVLDCEAVPWPNAVIKNKYQIQDCGWPERNFAYECKINLVTGRTHQIRTQFAACGAPLVGDSMYMPAALAELTNPGVNPFGKYKKEYSCEDDKRTAVKNWISMHGKEPGITIGLQACQISWDDDTHIYEAQSPWY